VTQINITELKGLSVEEISLVAKPANERMFLLLKQEGGNTLDALDDVLKSLTELDIDLENSESIENVMKKMKLSEKACKAAKGALKLMSAYKEEMPKGFMEKLLSMAEYGDMAEEEMKPKPKGGKEMPKETPVVEEKKRMKKEDGTLDINAIPEESRELVQMLWKEHETAVQKAVELETILKAERDIRVTKEFQERGKGFPNIGTAEIVGSVLRKAFDVSDDYGKQLEGLLKDADTKIEKSELFVEKGTSAKSNADNAWAKIEELAKGIVTKGQGQTMAQAIDRVLAENPLLYEEYLKERSGK
jgi:RNAse (barnase) inhibitor barstar